MNSPLQGLLRRRCFIPRRLALAVAAAVAMVGGPASGASRDMDIDLEWHQLPPVPDAVGFAGSFAGAHHGALIVAGGANFPDKHPWEGGTKVWYDHVLVLEKPDAGWRKAGKLPRPLGYGVSVSTTDGVICVGGSDASGHHAAVFRVEYTKGMLSQTRLPPLPCPCANMCGAALDHTIYICGGIETPTATRAMNSLWALDLKHIEAGWKTLEPLPGRERMLATAGAAQGSLYIFSGAALKNGPDDKPVREWLKDAWCYTPKKGWKQIADLPRVSVAAPSPAPEENGRLLVIGGDDGAQVDVEPAAHKGFPRDMLAYDPKHNRWTRIGEVPFSLVTTTTAEWRDRIVIPGGEAKPGIRSAQVWSAKDR